jgi:hypothetical protein
VGCGDGGEGAPSDGQGGQEDAPSDAGEDGGEDVGEDADAPDPDELVVPEGCNPISVGWDCLLPYPSDAFLVADPTTATGRRLAVPQVALPQSAQGADMDLNAPFLADGFSFGGQITVAVPGGVDASRLEPWTGDVERSLGEDSPTVLLEAETGERVLHLAEVDGKARPGEGQALLLRPLVRLKPQTRYVVALRGLADAQGAQVAPPEAFRRLRDGEAGSHPVLGPLAARYEGEVFGVLEAAGVERGGLQLAWDFTVRSEQSAWGDMLQMRAQALERWAQAPPRVTVTRVLDDVSPTTARRIEGTLQVPLFLDKEGPGGKLTRDPQGRPVAQGVAEVPFLMLIPRSVWEAQGPVQPARLLQFGHGFFGSREEIADNFIHEMADELGMVVLAVDWWGMSGEDVVQVAQTLQAEPREVLRFGDRVHQAMVNQLAVSFAARGPLLEAAEVQREGVAVYDPAQLYFMGLSQGHILGGVYLSLSPHVERGVLGVGGASFTLMMSRAKPFEPFLLVLGVHLKTPLDVQKWTALAQTGFDRFDPLTYAPWVREGGFPDTPARREVLLQIGVGDTQVPNLASHLHGRALGVPLLAPAPRDPGGFGEPVAAPWEGSALVEFDFGKTPPPDLEARAAREGNEVHEGVRRLGAAVEQLDAFLRPEGQARHLCDGVCDPE